MSTLLTLSLSLFVNRSTTLVSTLKVSSGFQTRRPARKDGTRLSTGRHRWGVGRGPGLTRETWGSGG